MSRERLTAARLLAAFAALILYASFYPFELDRARLAQASAGSLGRLVMWGFSSEGDRIVNVIAYLPLGFLMTAAGSPAAGAIASGFALSLLVVDDSHATGVLGKTGRGTGEEQMHERLAPSTLRTRPLPVLVSQR